MSFVILNKTTGNVLAASGGQTGNDRIVKPWLVPDRGVVDAKIKELLLKNPTETYVVYERVDVFTAKVEVVRG